MNLVFLVAIVVEDFSNQRTPHQLRVSMFDLKHEDNSTDKYEKSFRTSSKTMWLFFKTVVNISLCIFLYSLKL